MMDRDQDAARLWPPKDTPAFKMLMDMISGHNVWSPAPARDTDLDRLVAELRWLGWPVVRTWQVTEQGTRWTYGLHKSVINEAASEIRRMAWQNAA